MVTTPTIIELTESRDLLGVATCGYLWLVECGEATPLSVRDAARLLVASEYPGGYGIDWILVDAKTESEALAIGCVYDAAPTLNKNSRLCAIHATGGRQ